MEEKKKNNVGIIISCIINVLLVLVIVLIIIFYRVTINNIYAIYNNDNIDSVDVTNNIEDIDDMANINDIEETNITNDIEETSVDDNNGDEIYVSDNPFVVIQKTNTTNEFKNASKIDNSKDLVFFEKFYNEEMEKEFQYPQVNLNYDNIKGLNERIKGYARDTSYILENKYYINNDILSLVITDCDPGAGHITYVFNIDLSNGNILTNEELLNKLKITENVNEKISNSVIKHLQKVIPKGSEDSYSESIRMNNLDANKIEVPLFINNEGQLCMVVRYFIHAGGDNSDDNIIVIEK